MGIIWGKYGDDMGIIWGYGIDPTSWDE